MTAGDQALLDVSNLGIRLDTSRGPAQAVREVSFALRRGETLGIVGESGCGKSTLGKAILRLVEPSGGRILFDGEDLTALPERALRSRRKRLQMVFQDPFASLNPRQTIGEILSAPLAVHGVKSRAERQRRVDDILARVGLPPDSARRYPHEFSGGQRQRVAIARALASEADFIVCDEPTSALDVSVQAQILNLMRDLQDKFGLTYLFISHNLAVVRHMASRIGVMYLGRIVETAPSRLLYSAPKHPYTEALLSAVPIPDPSVKRKRIRLKGEVPSPIDPPSGCHFHTRCPIAKDVCSKEVPPLKASAEGHLVACHFR